MSTRRTRTRRLRAVALAALTAGLCALVPGAAAGAATPTADPRCQSGNGASSSKPYSIQFQYRGGTTTVCGYDGQWDWLTAARDATVRGVQGTSGYAYIVLYDGSVPGLNHQVVVDIGFPANYRSVNTSRTDVEGPSGWRSVSEARCNVDLVSHAKTEAVVLSYWLYDVGEIAAKRAAVAEILAPSGNEVAYAPGCDFRR